MATNDFLPFAIGVGANVIPQATYSAATALRASGFSSGVADSSKLNKVWRQGSVMAAAIGKIVTDNNFDALDNGDVPALADNIVRSMGLALGRPGHTFGYNDWIPLAGGLILQWGYKDTITSGDSQVMDIVFPVPFTTSCLNFVASAGVSAAAAFWTTNPQYRTDTQSINFGIPSLTGCPGRIISATGTALDARRVQWLAIGF